MNVPRLPLERTLLEFDDFRVDPKRRRLLRRGEPIAITPKAFSILLILLDKRGEIVEKEDLLKEVWPDTFVTEANLTQNVSALRKALGETANESRYIVTVPGRGYSFAGEVQEVPRDTTGEIQLPILSVPAGIPPPAEPEPLALSGTLHGGAVEAGPAREEAPGATVRRRLSARALWLGSAFLALAIAAGLLFARNWSGRPSASSPSSQETGAAGEGKARPALAVLGFKNVSGNEDYGWIATALGEMLTTELAASPSVRVIASESVARLRLAAPFAYPEDLAPEQLERLHTQLGADLIVLGTYFVSPELEGKKIRLDLRVLRAPSGELVATLGLTGLASTLIDLGADAGQQLRLRLGWSEPSPEAARAAAALQPSSTRSAQLYAQGLERLRASDAAGARNLLLAAVAADPGSPLIHSVLSQAYTELGSDAEARRESEAALRSAGELPREQRLEIEARFRETRQDWERASEIYRSLWLLHPERLEYGLRLVHSLSMAGRGSEATTALADLRRLPEPQRDDPRIDLAESQNARKLGNPDLEMSAARTAEEKGRRLGQPQVVAEALLLQGDAHYNKGMPEESIRALEGARQLFQQSGNRAAVARTLNRIAAADMDTGKLAEAARQFEEAKGIAEEIGSDSLVASQIGALGINAMRQGDLRQAARLCEDSYRRFVALGDRFYETRMLFFLAQALALAGETTEAQGKLNQVLSLAQSSGNRVDEAQARAMLGTLLVDAGRFTEGRQSQEQALRLAREHGDPFLAASYLTAIGETLVFEGKFDLASQQLTQALVQKQKVKDPIGETTILGHLGALALRRGDLAGARQLAQRHLDLARRVGAALEEVEALRALGRIEFAAADLPQARRHLGAALSAATRLGAGRQAAATRLDLSRLSLAEGATAEAARQAAEAAAWFQARKIVGWEGRALLAVADAALARRRLEEAAKASSRAFYLSTSPTDEDRELKLGSVMRDAVSALARGSLGEASGHLRGMLETAGQAGEVPLWLEARSIEAELILRRGDRPGAAAAFQALARDARARGFLLVAQRASQRSLAALSRPLG